MKQFEIDPNWLRYPVESSQIRELAFDKENNRMYIRFWNKSVYVYEPFTFKQFEEFRIAESIGKYFYANIKSKITAKKITNGD